MDTAHPISFNGLTKAFGTFTAVNNLSFTVQPGKVTGFLGPNGSGKTTTLRMLLGLTKPTSGTATFGNTPYQQLSTPLNTVGAALDATNLHPGRTGRDHLRTQAPLAGADDQRVDELLGLVGLDDAATQRVNGYSLGMRQRLALAAALLGNPQYLVLDEPANGLDPQGIRWLRDFLRHLAGEGRTILVSSHMLSEVQQTVDDVVIIAHGTLRFSDSMAALRPLSAPVTRVVTPNPNALREVALAHTWEVTPVVSDHQDDRSAVFEVRGAETSNIGTALFNASVELHELADVSESLENSFLRMTAPPASEHNAAQKQVLTQGEES